MNRLFDVYLVVRDIHGRFVYRYWQSNWKSLDRCFWWINRPEQRHRKDLFTHCSYIASYEISERD